MCMRYHRWPISWIRLYVVGNWVTILAVYKTMYEKASKSTANSNNLRVLKFKAQRTNASLPSVKSVFSGFSQLPTTAMHCFVVWIVLNDLNAAALVDWRSSWAGLKYQFKQELWFEFCNFALRFSVYCLALYFEFELSLGAQNKSSEKHLYTRNISTFVPIE